MFANCSSLQNTTQQTVNGRIVEHVVKGNGKVSIVLETGMGPTIDTWRNILDTLSTVSKVYAYNRPGYGTSSLHNPPFTVTDVAKQLHDNLKSSNIPPPYLLVGHSAGGLYINMFARLFPDEVAGVIFLDASHPQQFEYFKNEQQLLYNTLTLSIKKSTRKYELDIVKNTLSDFEKAPPFPKVPISVLTAGKKSSFLESNEMRQQWLIFQKELSQLSPKSNHIIVEGSGHYIHQNRPDVVIEEIKRILDNK
ncbi:alpha/beta fold hydrolase [Flagellimonas nanhaiensis]|nr:alpha/beta fold hydrolase [Allomuricauda nanhaiensis]